MDVNKLLKALEDDSNESLMNFTTDKIIEMNLKIIKELELSKKDTLEMMNKLKGYKYIDEINELKYGSYIRWISIIDYNNIHLTRGAIFCEVKIKDDGVFCLCKNHGPNSRHFQIEIDKKEYEKLLVSKQDTLNYLKKYQKRVLHNIYSKN